ncbi:hypothetical protein Tco_0815932 [Tanacetum coccineum]
MLTAFVQKLRTPKALASCKHKAILALGLEYCLLKEFSTIDEFCTWIASVDKDHVGGGAYESEGFGWTWGGQRGNMEMDPDIENMTISEYLEYEAAKKEIIGQCSIQKKSKKDDDSEEDQEEDGVDEDTFDMWDIMVEDVEWIRKNFNVPKEIDEIAQPLIPEPIHTTPPNDDYVAPATKSILDELLEEFGDEILNVTMVDDKVDFNPTKDLEELERLLTKEPQSNFMEIQGYYSEETEFEVSLPYNCVVKLLPIAAITA